MTNQQPRSATDVEKLLSRHPDLADVLETFIAYVCELQNSNARLKRDLEQANRDYKDLMDELVEMHN